MAPYINLDKLTFYKDDIVDNKIYIKGNISGLDPNKQYCVMWSCAFCSTDNNMYGKGRDYFYLRNTSSISLTNNEAHIDMDYIVWNIEEDPVRILDYSDVYIFINEVNGNCETVTNELVATRYIKVYDKYAPVGEGEAEIYNVSFRNSAGSIITEAEEGEFIHAVYSIKNIGNADDNFYSEAIINGNTISDKVSIISKNYSKNFVTDDWYMSDNDSVLNIEAGHYENGTWIKDDTFTKTINLKEPEEKPEEPTIGEITSIPYPELVGDEVIFKVNIKNTGLKTAFYYVDLWDEDHNFIDKEPDTYLYYVALEPGETGIITISSNWKDWNVDSILNQTIQFDLRGAEITWAGARPIVGYYITDTLTFEYVPPEEEEEEQVIPCTNYTTKSECEVNGCYWWESDQTCQSMPDETTEYFDIIIKPYSWYSYNEAVNNTIKKLSDIGGALSNLLYKYTDIQYNGIDILEDVNKEHIIIRIYVISKSQSDSQISTLVFPAFIIAHPILVGLIVGAIAGIILFTVGFIIGTSGGNFTKSDITQLLENIVKNAKIDAYVYGYDINKTLAIKLMNCLEIIETCEDSLSCFTNTGVTPSLRDQMEVLVAYQTTVDAAYTGVTDILDDEEYEKLASKTISQLEFVIEKMESATITPDGAACEASDVMDDAGEDLKKKEEEQKEEECAWEIAGQCILTKDALNTAKWIGIGVGGLILYSATKR